MAEKDAFDLASNALKDKSFFERPGHKAGEPYLALINPVLESLIALECQQLPTNQTELSQIIEKLNRQASDISNSALKAIVVAVEQTQNEPNNPDLSVQVGVLALLQCLQDRVDFRRKLKR